MTCWNHQPDQHHWALSPRQIRWLREHVGAFHDAVRRDQEWRPQRRCTSPISATCTASMTPCRLVLTAGTTPRHCASDTLIHPSPFEESDSVRPQECYQRPLSLDPPMNWLVVGCRNEESAP